MDPHPTKMLMSLDTQMKLQLLAWAGFGEESQELLEIKGSFIL